MGGIDTDPASCEAANATVKAVTYYDLKSDGLKKKWFGRVFMNPPYAQPLIAEFSRAVASKYSNGEISEAIILVNNATETEWFGDMVKQSAAVCFPKGRIKFVDKNGNPGGAPLQGQAILYMGKNKAKFATSFAGFGWVSEICHE